MLTVRWLALVTDQGSTRGEGIGAACSSKGGSSIDGVVCLGRNVIPLDSRAIQFWS
jgi:hypothetical protein